MDCRYGIRAEKPTLDEVVKEKMKVLKDFKVVSMRNKAEIEQQLFDEAKANPNRDYEIVLEQITQSMIMESLGDA